MTAVLSWCARSSLLASLAATLAAGGCADDGGTAEGSGATASTGATEPAPTTGAVETASTGETASTSTGADATDTGTTTGDPVDEAIPPVIGVPNLDDDDENGKRDWFDPVFAADDDLVEFALPASYIARVQPGERVEVTLDGEVEQVRLWRGSEVALGDMGDAESPTSLTLGADELAAPMQIEFGDFLRRATLTLRHLGADGAERDVRDVALLSAPLLINHHLQPAEAVWAVKAPTNGAMIATMTEALGDRFIAVDNPDIWIQDELEWATATAPGQRLDVAMDSIRDRPLDAWVKAQRAPDVEPITWGKAGTDTTEDKFGNLEVTPPHSAGGVEYPFGRIYYGQDATCGPNEILTEFLDRQKVQAPILVDTCWLCVGHVDEFLSFVPDAAAPRGFRFLISDVPAAYAILDAMDPDTALPRYADSHGYATVGELVGDVALRARNLELQADHLDPMRERFQSEMGLTEDEILRIPGLFEEVNGCSYKDNNAVAALIPGMLNLTVANFAGETPRIFVSDPFMRSDLDDPESDPLLTNFRAVLPPEYEIHFVDDWYTYHTMIGEVHCGTNVARTPTADWWQAALPLIEEP